MTTAWDSGAARLTAELRRIEDNSTAAEILARAVRFCRQQAQRPTQHTEVLARRPEASGTGWLEHALPPERD